jgi:hypothetical protein
MMLREQNLVARNSPGKKNQLMRLLQQRTKALKLNPIDVSF